MYVFSLEFFETLKYQFKKIKKGLHGARVPK
jgi:hypothetical protein